MHVANEEAEEKLRGILRDVLGINAERAAALKPESGLFGVLPELDSMAVANLLTEIEDRIGITVEDDEIDGEMLESFGSLTEFVSGKLCR